jgi:hypothetical protein
MFDGHTHQIARLVEIDIDVLANLARLFHHGVRKLEPRGRPALATPILAAFDRSNATLGVSRHIQYALDLCAMREIVTSNDTDHRAK